VDGVDHLGFAETNSDSATSRRLLLGGHALVLMFRFTIRDVLWLTVVVGLVIGWRFHYASWHVEDAEYPAKYRRTSELFEQCATENEQLKNELNQLRDQAESPKVNQLNPGTENQ